MSNKTHTVFKDLYDNNKAFALKKLPFNNHNDDIILAEKAEEYNYRMNLRMCAWAGVLAEENYLFLNKTELNFAEKLITSCYKVFLNEKWSDYLYLEMSGLVTKDSEFSIPGEIFESTFFLFRATSDNSYRKLAFNAFKAIKDRCKKSFGYSCDGKLMPHDFFSKTLKFLFLLFNDSNNFSRSVFSSTGHLIGYFRQ